MPSCLKRERAYVFIGFCFFCGMLRAPFFGALTAGITATPELLRLAYDGCMMALGFLLYLTARKKFLELRGPNFNLLCLLGLFAPLGMGLIIAGRPQIADETALCFVGVIFLGMGFAAISTCWFQQFLKLGANTRGSFALLAFAASHLLAVFDILPRDAEALVSISYPTISLAMLAFCNAEQSRSEYAQNKKPSPIKQSTSSQDDISSRRLRPAILLFVFAEILCGALMRSRWAHGGINYYPEFDTIHTYLVSALIGLFLFHLAKNTKTTIGEALVIGGIGLSLLILSAVSYATLPVKYLAPFVTGFYSALVVYLIPLIVFFKTGDSPSNASLAASSACAGIFLSLYAFASGITSTIVPRMLSYQQTMPEEHLASIGIVSGFTIALGVCAILFSAVKAQHENPSPSIDSDDETISIVNSASNARAASSHEQTMNTLAKNFGLTEREKETASLIAQGYTARHVARELVVALSTVQSYSKSIYRKMEIHCKDELIELVDAERRRND